jgi:hypothetical protein
LIVPAIFPDHTSLVAQEGSRNAAIGFLLLQDIINERIVCYYVFGPFENVLIDRLEQHRLIVPIFNFIGVVDQPVANWLGQHVSLGTDEMAGGL